VRSFILPQGKGDTFPNYIIGQLSISKQATSKFKTGHYTRNPASTQNPNRNVPRNGNGKEFFGTLNVLFCYFLCRGSELVPDIGDLRERMGMTLRAISSRVW
jgi:hypothetical protein